VTAAEFTTFGDLLKYLRRRARLTQSELALAVGYSREQITKLENNQRQPDLTTLKALFVPALDLQEQPTLETRLFQLAAAARERKVDSAEHVTPESRIPRTNLPADLTSFVGREREVAEVKRLLGSTRLLALTGAGGVGKTRLALRAGVELLDEYPDGVWLVELASLSDPARVPGAVAAALGLAVASGPALESALADYVRDKHLLLILDNCEHLLVACARLAELLLRAAPRVHLLATSRESLGVLSASAWNVPSLSLPADQAPTPDQLLQSEAVQLFTQRAAAGNPDFTLTPENSDAVAQICRRLDGVPLAIELAATRVRVMSVQQIAARLDRRFDLLTGGNRAALPRHQTLRAAMDWSYDLLSEAEGELLRRLSVFVGGWALEAAEFVGGAGALGTLAQLVNKSLVVMDERGDSTRYHLLETVAEYAREKLARAGDEASAHRQRQGFLLPLMEAAVPQLFGPGFPDWFQRLEMEHDNLRAALGWAVNHDPPAALQLLAGLWYFWFRGGHWVEGTAWAQKIIPITSDQHTSARAYALLGAANLAARSGLYTGIEKWLSEGETLAEAVGDDSRIWARITRGLQLPDHAQAVAMLEEAITLARASDSAWLTAEALFVLGERERGAGHLDRAAALYTDSLQLFRPVGDPSASLWPLGNLGRLAFQRGDYAEAQAAFDECVSRWRALGNKAGVVDWLIQLAAVAQRQGDAARARAALAECFQLARDIGNVEAIADCLVMAAGLAESAGELAEAAQLLAAVTVLTRRDPVHPIIDPASDAEYTRRVASVQARLSEPAFEAAWAEGQALTLQQAIDLALDKAVLA
jgi:predicted ATPase/DNA-binding XRE family transcriptional regulator